MINNIYYSFLIITLSGIAYQDLKYREVTWILFPSVAIIGILISLQSTTVLNIFQHWCINFLFLLLQYLLAKFAINLKNRTKKKDIVLGLGDILFLLSSAFFFSVSDFIKFYILSLLFSLVIFLLIIRPLDLPNNGNTIPLAGLQSIFMIILFVLQHFMKINLSIDQIYLFK